MSAPSRSKIIRVLEAAGHTRSIKGVTVRGLVPYSEGFFVETSGHRNWVKVGYTGGSQGWRLASGVVERKRERVAEYAKALVDAGLSVRTTENPEFDVIFLEVRL